MKVVHKIEIEVPDLGDRIRKARKASRKSMAQLCGEADVTSSYWYQIEAGTLSGGVTLTTIRAIEKALEVDLGVQFKWSHEFEQWGVSPN